MASSPDAAPPGLPPSDDPEVVFIIPLISRARAYDWGVVQRHLRATLGALRAQTSPRWRALVCCQDRPEEVAFDGQVSFLPFVAADVVRDETAVVFDNHAKKDLMLDHLAATHGGDGYVFQLDADDLLHPRLVEHIVADNNGAGYWIERGYMYDVARDRLAYLGPKRLRYPFGHTFLRECGSSSALRFDFRRDARCLETIRDRGKHAEVPARMAAHGLAMTPVPFPAALYLVGHGENMRQRRGKLGAKMRYMRRNRLLPRAARRVRNEFRLRALLEP
ncbi:hypothetical protein OG2516_04326 [Oceanicola granulosus HTCC2516]|uniref:Uncharacterized protein n=1 Tax=Oceanicola granulosus (strain ATCC BAA-861 / DSM 15982 / KCTC 12143 / HTCC2516) TaxID=314256 RepID=Q2CA54_OCEGH|nr:hypothetical protein [Oceanicola granulosus]EAR49558.1 hypothetical protein OG2516_04326 [Oceanicola granulosus HTCC2516]